METTNLVVAGIMILQDDAGRYNLNTLHQASGSVASKRPSDWLRRKTTQALITELTGQVVNSPLDSMHGGERAGTYVHELLAVSYAAWISPAFQLRVNQAFLDARYQHAPIPQVKNPANQLMIDTIVRLDAVEQRAFEAERRALVAETKADLALADAHRMTVDEFVIKTGLLRQFPPESHARLGKWLARFCLDYGLEVQKAPCVGKSWLVCRWCRKTSSWA